MMQHSPPMKRRTLLAVGAGAGLVLAAGGAVVASWSPGVADGRFTARGRAVFSAVAAAVLEGSLPTAPDARRAALDAHLTRLEATVSAFPPPTQAEIAELATLLGSPPGRLALAGLVPPWEDAAVAEVQAMLQSLRTSRLALRQQVYHALRDLTNAAWYSDPAAWAPMGYGGPVPA
jgi:hypothetical protein